jgi:hypothetical protein
MFTASLIMKKKLYKIALTSFHFCHEKVFNFRQPKKWHCDNQHYDTQLNGPYHDDTQYYKSQYNDLILTLSICYKEWYLFTFILRFTVTIAVCMI